MPLSTLPATGVASLAATLVVVSRNLALKKLDYKVPLQVEAASNPSGMPPLRVFCERKRDSRLESWVAYAGGILPENL
jgi:hypothetical protein